MAKPLGRNDPCRCGSGRKYKNCCLEKDDAKWMSKSAMIAIAIVMLVGIVLGGISFMDEGGEPTCPSGTVWSDAHNHCH